MYLIQRGSAESKDPDEHEAVDDDPRDADQRRRVPWPVRRGGIWLLLYENSLLLAFIVLFVASLVGHALGGVDAHNAELHEHGQPTLSLWGYVSSSQFWFESFQNWQSEFLAVFAIVVLTDLPPPAGLARVEAGRRAAPVDRLLKDRAPPQRAWRHTRHRSPGRNTVVAPS